MLRQMLAAYQQTQSKCKKYQSNIGVVSESIQQKFRFMIAIRERITISFLQNKYEEDELSSMEVNVIQSVFEAILADTYHLASCVHFSNFVMLALLESRHITQRIELIEVTGNPLKIGYWIQESSRNIPIMYTSHNIVAWGRERGDSIENIHSFKGICDPWNNGLILEYSNEKMPATEDFTKGQFSLDHIRSVFSVSQNVTDEEWKNISKSLADLKQYIQERFSTFCKQNNYPFNPAELAEMMKAFDIKIKLYAQLSNSNVFFETKPASSSPLLTYSLYRTDPMPSINDRSTLVRDSHTETPSLNRSSCGSLSIRR